MVANAQPVAEAGADRLVGVNQEVLFDGSASADPDGSIAAWVWDFDDGSSAEGVNARHRFRDPGRYEVTLTVRDETDLPNNAATDSLFVEVNAPPEPVIAAPAVACVDEPVRFDATGSNGADGGIQRFAWSFGDSASAEGPEVEHRFPRARALPGGVARRRRPRSQQQPAAGDPSASRESAPARLRRPRPGGLPRRACALRRRGVA